MTRRDEAISRLTAWLRDFRCDNGTVFVEDIETLLESVKTDVAASKWSEGETVTTDPAFIFPDSSALNYHRLDRPAKR